VVPDNLKSGVTRPCYYEPDLNPTYQDMAQHYGIAIIPARPKKPRDKAKVESAVLVAERWILAALRNHRFFSIAELNKAIRQKLTDLNNRPMQVLKKTPRREIETRLVESARFREDEIQDVYSMMEERSEREVSRKHSEEHDELMQLPEVQEQIAEIIHKHWEGWVDESIPALGGQTPREAISSPDGRESVAALLREAERDQGQDPFMAEANRKGTRWVRELLGLNDQ
jgi:hypothetical protein